MPLSPNEAAQVLADDRHWKEEKADQPKPVSPKGKLLNSVIYDL
jgi:hypothetical protein